MKIDLVAWGDDISGLSFKSGAGKGDITALGFRYSEPVPYSGPAVMEIYQARQRLRRPRRRIHPMRTKTIR